jgi:hypothetical protein
MAAPATPTREPPRRSPLGPALLALVSVIALVVLGTAYVVHRAASLPRDLAREGRATLEKLRDLVASFQSGTAVTSFAREATEIVGSSRLQFATLKQVEVFERRDGQTLFWGQLPLPDVVVEARAPVEYTYFLDLEKAWTLRLEGDTLFVATPPIEWNQPAVDVSALTYTVRESSVFRDEAAVLGALRASMTEATRVRARGNVALVRETGRVKAQQFVGAWLERRLGERPSAKVVVVFPGEPALPPEPVPALR